jgi:hypothetical protein
MSNVALEVGRWKLNTRMSGGRGVGGFLCHQAYMCAGAHT